MCWSLGHPILLPNAEDRGRPQRERLGGIRSHLGGRLYLPKHNLHFLAVVGPRRFAFRLRLAQPRTFHCLEITGVANSGIFSDSFLPKLSQRLRPANFRLYGLPNLDIATRVTGGRIPPHPRPLQPLPHREQGFSVSLSIYCAAFVSRSAGSARSAGVALFIATFWSFGSEGGFLKLLGPKWL